MAWKLIKAIKREGVDFVVAPYEADAQMALLCRLGLADFVISEDSDCIPFGCPRVLFKLNSSGTGMEYRQDNLPSCKKLNLFNWTTDQILDLCILSGCDYLPSIRGMGLIKAHKHMLRHRTVRKVLRAIRFAATFTVPATYEDEYEKARLTFRHMRCYNPKTEAVVHLHPLPPELQG